MKGSGCRAYSLEGWLKGLWVQTLGLGGSGFGGCECLFLFDAPLSVRRSLPTEGFRVLSLAWGFGGWDFGCMILLSGLRVCKGA